MMMHMQLQFTTIRKHYQVLQSIAFHNRWYQGPYIPIKTHHEALFQPINPSSNSNKVFTLSNSIPSSSPFSTQLNLLTILLSVL